MCVCEICVCTYKLHEFEKSNFTQVDYHNVHVLVGFHIFEDNLIVLIFEVVVFHLAEASESQFCEEVLAV